jgi:hypothetical protein
MLLSMLGDIEFMYAMGLMGFLSALICVAVTLCIVRRKGERIWLFCGLALIPWVGLFTTFLLSSLPDKNVLDRLDALEKKARLN